MQELEQKKKVEEFFDGFAKERKSILSAPATKHIYSSLLSRITNEAGLNVADRILDAGCGSGEHLEMLESMGFTNLFGFDLSEEMVRIAREKCRHAKIEKGDTEKLAYPSDFFDAMIAITLLMYLPEPKKGLMELKRVLKRGGKLIVINQNFKGSLFKNLIIRKGKLNLYSQPWNKDFDWSIESTKKLLEESGFNVVYVISFGFVLSKCPEYLLRLNILLEKILERTFYLSNFGKDILIIAEKI